MTYLLFILLVIGFSVGPVMIGARLFKAKNTGFGPSLVAVIVLAAVSLGVDKLIGNPWLGSAASAIAGGFFLARILGTSFWRGIGVSLVAVAVQVIVIVVFSDT
jgi:hypothetical protein